MSFYESRAYVMPDVLEALRYAHGRAESNPGRWVYVRTQDQGALLCAWCVARAHYDVPDDEQPDIYEIVFTRADRDLHSGDLYTIYKALDDLEITDRIGEPVKYPNKHMLVMKFRHPRIKDAKL